MHDCHYLLQLMRVYSNRMSIHDAIDGVNQDSPKLEGYLALTDSIVPLILNASESDSEEDHMNDPNNESDRHSLEKAKRILWRLQQRDLLDLIDEVDSTETETVPLILLNNDNNIIIALLFSI